MRTINLLSLVSATSVTVDDSSTLLTLATSQSSTAANLLVAVGHRNVTAMESLVQELALEAVSAPTGDDGDKSQAFSADIQQALKAIREQFVSRIQNALQSEHKADQEHFNCFTQSCFGECTSKYKIAKTECKGLTRPWTSAGQTEEQLTCEEYGEKHKVCRQDVFTKYVDMAEKCGKLHCFVPKNHEEKYECKDERCLCHDLTNCQYDGTYQQRQRQSDMDSYANQYDARWKRLDDWKDEDWKAKTLPAWTSTSHKTVIKRDATGVVMLKGPDGANVLDDNNEPIPMMVYKGLDESTGIWVDLWEGSSAYPFNNVDKLNWHKNDQWTAKYETTYEDGLTEKKKMDEIDIKTRQELLEGEKQCQGFSGHGPKECTEQKFGSWLLRELTIYKEEEKRWRKLHTECKAAYEAFLRVDMTCDETQKTFESCICERNSCEKIACNVDYDRCEAQCWARYKELVGDKECLEKNRKIDWSATKKIECYLDVLLHDYTETELRTTEVTPEILKDADNEGDSMIVGKFGEKVDGVVPVQNVTGLRFHKTNANDVTEVAVSLCSFATEAECTGKWDTPETFTLQYDQTHDGNANSKSDIVFGLSENPGSIATGPNTQFKKARSVKITLTKGSSVTVGVLIEKECNGGGCINKEREVMYKACATVCPEVDYEGHWPEATGDWSPGKIWGSTEHSWSITEHGYRSSSVDHVGRTGMLLGDYNVYLKHEKPNEDKPLYKCDANGDMVFTKHRGGVAAAKLEKRCTEHLDIDYQVPQCMPCDPPPAPVCDAAFIQKWYHVFDDITKTVWIHDTGFTTALSGDDCSKGMFGMDGYEGEFDSTTGDITSYCFLPQEIESSADGISKETLTVNEHTHAWAYNRCPCAYCNEQMPVYPTREDGRQCGMGAHTISPTDKVKKQVEESTTRVCIDDTNDNDRAFAEFEIADACVTRITLTHQASVSGQSGTVSCQTETEQKYGRYAGTWENNLKDKTMYEKTMKNAAWTHNFRKDATPQGGFMPMVSYEFVGDTSSYSVSNWGCHGHSLGLVMSDATQYNRISAPVAETTVGMATEYSKYAHRYSMDGVDFASKSMTWTFETPLRFGGSYRMWYNEALRDDTLQFGKVCYDMTVEKSIADTCPPAPLQFSNVCTSGTTARRINLPVGTCVAGVSLHWVSGFLPCTKDGTSSRFGCGAGAKSYQGLGSWTEDFGPAFIKGDATIDTSTCTAGVVVPRQKKAGGLVTDWMTGSATARTLSWKANSPSKLEGDLDLWYLQDLPSRSPPAEDSPNTACYEVTVHQSSLCP
jgi:hypothetical protein